MRLVERAHQLVSGHLHPGARAIDATAGNGHDTALLAKAVGTRGSVLSIDTQAEALAATRARLDAGLLLEQVELRRGCHAEVLEEAASAAVGDTDAIIFNLGYLPGSDRTVRTKAATTVRALDAASILLRPGGLLVVTAYRGHPGGAEEAAAVEAWMRAAKRGGWRVECTGADLPEAKAAPPILWAARKNG